MIVYKYFIRIALRHKSIILGYGILFLFLSIVNSGSTEINDMNFIDESLKLGVIDHSKTEISRGLVDFLASKNKLVDIVEDEDYIREEIFLQTIDGAIIIPSDFQDRLMKKEEAIKLYKNDRKAGAYYLSQQIDKYLVFANASCEKGQYPVDQIKDALKEEASVELWSRDQGFRSNGASDWFAKYYNFTSYIIIAIYINVIGLIMGEFNEENLEGRLRTSSKRLLQYNREIYLGQISLGFIITSVFVLGSLLMKFRYVGEVNLFKYLINIYIFSFSILCLSFLINTISRNKHAINGLSTVLSLGTSFISGVFVSQDLLGERVLSIAKFFPTYYFVSINEKTMTSFSDIAYELIMQVSFGLGFLLLGLYFSKKNFNEARN